MAVVFATVSLFTCHAMLPVGSKTTRITCIIHYIMGFPMGWILRKWTMYVCRFVLWKNVEINRRCSDSRMFNNYCVREPTCLGWPSSRVFVVLCIFVVDPTTFFRILKETVATFPKIRGYCHLSEQLGLIQLLRKSAKPAARAKCRVS